MYHPYFRGKQFELLSVRESAPLIASAGFVPIVEPVRESLSGLNKALDALEAADAQAVVVVNPRHGDHKSNGESIMSLLQARRQDYDLISPAVLLTAETTIDDARGLIAATDSMNVTLLHAGFTEARSLAVKIQKDASCVRNIFLDANTNLLYRKHFDWGVRVLLRDGFRQQKNADYPPIERFSDMHATFRDRNFDGFGDFLTVGDNYSESGGPAYAVAIHLTYIDKHQDDEMFVYHFKSSSNDTPTDPAGKFAQALNELMRTLDSGESMLLETSAIRELRTLHERGHFPGLGYIKKLSIKHHLETLAYYHVSQENAI